MVSDHGPLHHLKKNEPRRSRNSSWSILMSLLPNDRIVGMCVMPSKHQIFVRIILSSIKYQCFIGIIMCLHTWCSWSRVGTWWITVVMDQRFKKVAEVQSIPDFINSTWQKGHLKITQPQMLSRLHKTSAYSSPFVFIKQLREINTRQRGVSFPGSGGGNICISGIPHNLQHKRAQK